MNTIEDILFFDLESDINNKIIAVGALLGPEKLFEKTPNPLFQLAKTARWIAGHNIVGHDLEILKAYQNGHFCQLFDLDSIDSLYWSPLLFPKDRYHKLIKGYQLNVNWINDPLKDSEAARDLLIELIATFQQLIPLKKQWLYALLKDQTGYKGMFSFLEERHPPLTVFELGQLIQQYFAPKICLAVSLHEYILKAPIALAYTLCTIDADPENTGFIAPWVLHQHPVSDDILKRLRTSCGGHLCKSNYCVEQHAIAGLKRYFGYAGFRSYEGEPLQENAVNTALNGDSLLAVFPTGGGKSLTFQLPALMSNFAFKALTVVISPLQSLMKDQVDVLQKRHEIVGAVTINGLLSPLERQEAFERVASGEASMLYISPESLRSKRILDLLCHRLIDRFVIDEAHCLSSWGQDFRVDYLYIGDFIKKLSEAKGLKYPIPVSCFTATAKPAVIEDICNYFKSKLQLDLQIIQTAAARNNLSYHVIEVKGDEEKNQELLRLLSGRSCPTIIYVSRTKLAELLADLLTQRGYRAQAFHGKMESGDKIKVMDNFMDKESGMDIVVATSAFGMGVDKDNVEMVIHYNISDSLENYVQEAGRAGRDPNLSADCYVLFDINDLDQHFQMLNNSRISQEEINQIWKGIKKFGNKNFIKSAKEIAKKAGWDVELYELETRVKAAIAALEQANYLKREENLPKVFANSISIKTFEDAKQLIDKSGLSLREKEQMELAISYIISRSRGIAAEGVDIDGLSESLSVSREKAMQVVQNLRLAGVLRDDKDLTAYVVLGQGKDASASICHKMTKIESALAELLFKAQPASRIQNSFRFYLRTINEQLQQQGIIAKSSDIKDILNYWQMIASIGKERVDAVHEEYRIQLKRSWADFEADLELRKKLAPQILTLLINRSQKEASQKNKNLVLFSILGLKKDYEASFQNSYEINTYEKTLLYLQHIGALDLKNGFIVYYNPMRIVRLEDNRLKQYTQTDYNQLAKYYEHKAEQIHIAGEYARRYIRQETEALQFVNDYFVLKYEDFLNKHFQSAQKKHLKRPITEEKFKAIVQTLSPEQLEVFNSKEPRIMVAAGPGSGKTKLLVHKVASLLLIEEVKPENFLMLTFSRPAAMEFKSRLIELVGSIAYGVDIHTYHGYAFQLMGRLGDLKRSETILKDAVKAIAEEEVALDRLLGKTVIVVDEYQDISAEEYGLLMAIVQKIENPRIIAVGDDDQNIYEFKGSSIEYMNRFISEEAAKLFFLSLNFRSAKNLVAYSNAYLKQVMGDSIRIKNSQPLQAHQQSNGQLEVYQYDPDSSIFQPLVEDIVFKLHEERFQNKSIAVLTFSNEEAIQLHSMLRERKIPAQLLADKDDFKLINLLELQIFLEQFEADAVENDGLISNQAWNEAKEYMDQKLSGSKQLDFAIKIIETFENTYEQKLLVDWNAYLSEAKVQDFIHASKKSVLISTMHKSKGKEFDYVWLLSNQVNLREEDRKRLLYVALTRAKKGLFIHCNQAIFKKLAQHTEDSLFELVEALYEAPKRLVLQASLNDLLLDSFNNYQARINVLKSGDSLHCPADASCFENYKKEVIGRFSTKFESLLKNHLNKGYRISAIWVGYMVVWTNSKGTQQRVVLPTLELVK